MPPSTSYRIWEMHGAVRRSQLCWAVTCAACVSLHLDAAGVPRRRDLRVARISEDTSVTPRYG